MYHPDTLSAMAKQKQLDFQQNRRRLADQYTPVARPNIGLIRKTMGFIERLLKHSEQSSAVTPRLENGSYRS